MNINKLNINKMKRLFVTLLLMTSFMASGIAYDFSAVCESGQALYYSINQGTETVQLVNGSYNNGDPRPSGNLVIPATVEHDGITYTIVSVGYSAFKDCIGLHSVVFSEPSCVTLLSDYSFQGCTGLVSVNLPNSLEKINSYAFKKCSALNSIDLPNGIVRIGYQAFINCVSVETVELPESLTEMGNEAFRYCTSLHSIVIPNSIVTIGNYSFEGCNRLSSVVIGNSTESIGMNSFANCSELQSVVFEDASSLTTISDNAFASCIALTSIEFPQSLVRIKSDAFKKCTSLKRIVLPNSVEYVESQAFINCSSVEEISLSNSLKEIGNSAFRNIPLMSIVYIPNDVISINDYAFASCTGLQKVIIGNKVTTVGNYVFEGCSNLEFVEIGCNLTNIGSNTFKGTNLQSMVIKAALPPIIKTNSFQGVSREIPITIPCGSLERYQSKDFWNEFTNYSEDYMFSITVLSEDEELGTVSIIQEPVTCDDMTVKVEALEKNGSVFKGWESNGLFVSNDNPYTFTLEEDLILVARFSGYGIEEPSIESMEIYPNPTNGVALVETVGIEKVEVYSVTGQLVKESKENVIDLSTLEAGTYILKVITPSGVVTKQIIKN